VRLLPPLLHAGLARRSVIAILRQLSDIGRPRRGCRMASGREDAEVRLMDVGTRSVVVIMISMMLAGCSMRVPAETVCGTYVTSYPFGTETIILNPDETFVQRVAIGQEQPSTVRGTWDFDPRRSRAFPGADHYGDVGRDSWSDKRYRSSRLA
jgi:hypothetical protein